MSWEAVTWAGKQRTGRSTSKSVLTWMANCAAMPQLRAFTSMAYLVEMTELNEKTVTAAIKHLEELGLITDTGERTGATRQIRVYQLNVDVDADAGEGSEGHQKRNPSKNGSLPKTESKPTKNGGKAPQKRSESPPKTVAVTGGTKEEQEETKARAGRASGSVQLPDWLPEDLWAHWQAHRKAKKAPLTPYAAELSIRVLDRLRGEGHDPVAVINESILRGWTGLFPLKAPGQATPAGASSVPPTWWESAEGVRQMGASIGLPYDGKENARRYMFRVFKAAGPGPWVERELTAAARMNEFEYERVFAYFMGEKPATAQQMAQRAAEQQQGATA
ncbi:hypothetical protein [Cupriavidus sp. HPC(L)]|uniref:hypothetical protein n=1 Tax=Cupriavidus sp. HPC(L) TaxID=1217418 RepID=UPI0005BDFF89|nr:hypothetical protein [Cupriavidus sp. HPC(L)]